MSEFVQRVVGKAAPPITLAICGLLAAQLFVIYYLGAKFGNDFGVYWRTALQPVDEIYFWRGRFPFPYAPTMLLWISPLALFPKWPAYFVFITGSLAAFVLACRPYLPKTAIALAVLNSPFMRGIYTGQVCALLAALLIWACGARNRFVAGIILGVIASVKPQIVILAPLMLALSRDWRAFWSAGGTLVLIIILSIAVFGAARWPEWVASMDHFHDAVANTGIIGIGVTPATVAERLGLPPIPFMIGGTLAGAAIIYRCRAMGPLERSTAIVAGSLMAAPYALDYDLVALFPLVALSVMQGHFWASLVLIATLHPLPLIVAAYDVLDGRRSRIPTIGSDRRR